MARTPVSAESYDLVILGSGSTAFAAAIRAAELGKTAAMTEARTLGGTCVNRGCLLSKNLIEAARIYWEAHHPRYPGLSPRGMDLDFKELIRQKDEVIHDYRDKKYQSIVHDSDRIKVLAGHATFTRDGAVEVDGQRLGGRQYLVATGSRPATPPIEGLDTVPHLTSDLLTSGESQELWELPKSLVIVGGGYIALELGQMFHRFGTAVTILERSERVLPGYEPEVSLAIREILEDEGVKIITEVLVRHVSHDGVAVTVLGDTHGGERRFTAERLLVAAGRVPNTAGIGTHTDSQMATPVGAHDGAIAASNALNGEKRSVDHTVIARTIFTDPPVAVVGLTEEEATRRGVRCNCGTLPMRIVPRAGAIQDTRGLIKMVLDWDSRRVLGVSMIGRDAGEVIHEAAMALRLKATVYDFIDMVHVYPTMAEALKIAALSFFKDVERLSCCAE